MKHVVADLWSFLSPESVIVVPTNMKGVMGRGVAKQARDRWPGLEVQYKEWLGHRQEWDEPSNLYLPDTHVVGGNYVALLPVKRDWSEKASVWMVSYGLGQLVYFQRTARSLMLPEKVYLPLLGAGFGGLPAEDVKTWLGILLNDNFTLVEPDASVQSKYADSFRPGVHGTVTDERWSAPKAGWKVRS